MSALLTYVPENLDLYTRPGSYMGATWEGWYTGGFGRHRESELIDNHNFDYVVAQLEAAGVNVGDAEGDGLWSRADDDAQPDVCIVRESHFAVGWVEWLAIKPTAYAALAIVDRLRGDADAYPILDESAYSDAEWEAAADYWESLPPRERLDWITNWRQDDDDRRRDDVAYHGWKTVLAAVHGDLGAAIECGVDTYELAK